MGSDWISTPLGEETDDSFEKMVRYLFEANKSGFTNDDIDSIEELIAYGESGVAYETLCIQLYEHDSPITKESYDLSEKIGLNKNFNENYWLPLKERTP